jgi:hypothetical protein
MADEQNPQNPQDQRQPELAGYPNVDELLKGYRASSAEAKRLANENAKLAAEKEAIWNAVNQRQDVPQRKTARDRLAEYGIPPDDVVELAKEVFADSLKPFADLAQARPKMLSEYPDYAKYEADVMDWVRADPVRERWYNEKFVLDPVGTAELAFLKFGEAKRRSAPAPNAPTGSSPADASLPTQRSGDARRVDETNSQNVEDAWEAYRKTGSKADAEKFAHARLKGVIREDFLRE